MSFREFLGIDDDELPLYTCDWCGKPKVSLWWSGTKVRYCSFRCSAAGSYHRHILIAATCILLTSIVFLIPVMMTPEYAYTVFFHPVFMIPLAIVVGINVAFIYIVYVGRSLRRKGLVGNLSESHSERVGEP